MAAEPPGDSAARQRLARMLADFGLLKEAAEMYRGIVQQEKQNAAAYQGLGTVEFQLGDYASAQQAFRRALAIDPSNQAAAKRAETAQKLLALDPTLPGLRPEERFRRSQVLLRDVVREKSRCSEGSASRSLTSEDRAARAALSQKRPALYSDAADSNLALAQRVWGERLTACAGAPVPDDALAVILAKTARNSGTAEADRSRSTR